LKIGVVFPQTEIGSDPSVLRDYTQAAEELGYTHILAYDHVVGADPSDRPLGFRGVYTHESLFHEPLVAFGYMAAITSTIEFVTGILILPQRQAVLVAKQAAELDVLSNGRLRLGVAVGWNPVEYEALNEKWTNRGRRIEEQIEVMRALWTNELVDYTGRDHRIDRAGILPLPVQRPIPIWMGGMSEPVMRRTARIADGWFPQVGGPTSSMTRAQAVETIHGYMREAGRDPSELGIEARLQYGKPTPDEWQEQVDGWRTDGATHASLNTMGAGLTTRQHIDAIRSFREGIEAQAGEFTR
jgi:probable F420-dependent oxidoreductase